MIPDHWEWVLMFRPGRNREIGAPEGQLPRDLLQYWGGGGLLCKTWVRPCIIYLSVYYTTWWSSVRSNLRVLMTFWKVLIGLVPDLPTRPVECSWIHKYGCLYGAQAMAPVKRSVWIMVLVLWLVVWLFTTISRNWLESSEIYWNRNKIPKLDLSMSTLCVGSPGKSHKC